MLTFSLSTNQIQLKKLTYLYGTEANFLDYYHAFAFSQFSLITT